MDEVKNTLREACGRIEEMESSQRRFNRDLGTVKTDMKSMQCGMIAMQDAMTTMQDAVTTMQRAMIAMQGAMTGMQGAVSSALGAIEMLRADSEQTRVAMSALRGTFASIEVHMVKLFEDQADTRAWRESTDARLDALEKRQPPAA